MRAGTSACELGTGQAATDRASGSVFHCHGALVWLYTGKAPRHPFHHHLGASGHEAHCLGGTVRLPISTNGPASCSVPQESHHEN